MGWDRREAEWLPATIKSFAEAQPLYGCIWNLTRLSLACPRVEGETG